jgi:hypothetical protein
MTPTKKDLSNLKFIIKTLIREEVSLLSEIHYEDIRISKGWRQFFDKYGSEEKVRELGYDIDDLYVNFVGRTTYDKHDPKKHYLPDVINKKMVTDRDSYSDRIPKYHNDPTGIYAYPLEYILSYPLSEKYGIGTGFKYIRVLLNLRKPNDSNVDNKYTGKKIDIHKVRNVSQIRDILLKAGELYPVYNEIFGGRSIDEIKNFLEFFKNNYFTNYIIKSNVEDIYPKILVFLLKHDLSRMPKQDIELAFSSTDSTEKISEKHFSERDGDDQAKLWKHIGFDVLSDDSRDNEYYSAINAFEPTQTVFLRRNAFKILDIYQKMYDKQYDENSFRNVNLQKIAAKSAAFLFGDKNIISIKKDPGYNIYEIFTKNKLLMTIKLESDDKLAGEIMYPSDPEMVNKAEKIGRHSPFNFIKIEIRDGNSKLFSKLAEYSLRPDEKLSEALPIIKSMLEDKIKQEGTR